MRTIGSRIRRVEISRVPAPRRLTDPHYFTPEHKAWRMAVIGRAGGRCERPGCGRMEPRMFADHIVELKDGGKPLDLSNGQCLCGRCHTIKTGEAKRLRAGA